VAKRGNGSSKGNPMNEEHVGLLISQAVHDEIGDRLSALARASGHALRFVISPDTPGSTIPADARASIRLAYYSRDIMQGSSKAAPSPASRAFFDSLDAAPRAEWLHVCSAGTDNYLYQPTLQRAVRLSTSSGSNAHPIAQAVVGAILAQARGFTRWLKAQAERRWQPLGPAQMTRDLHEQTAVIVGLGPIGRETGRLLKAVGLTTLGVRRGTGPVPHFDRICQLDALDTLLPECDWLVLACPLTPETRDLLNARRIGLLPACAGVVNVGRGELIDETALAAALHEGRLRSAYLDVFATEPLPADSPLWDAPNTWISPHNAAVSPNNGARTTDIFLRNFMHWLNGEPFENDATPSAFAGAAHTRQA
jgi:phosphoglycerate dehydrogenase-like enzyme